jgi:hypothetical protein
VAGLASVLPAEAKAHSSHEQIKMDSRLRGNDGEEKGMLAEGRDKGTGFRLSPE